MAKNKKCLNRRRESKRGEAQKYKRRKKILSNIQRKDKIQEIQLAPGLNVGVGFLRDIDSQTELLTMLHQHPDFNLQFLEDDILINGHGVLEKLVFYQRNL